MNSPTPNAEKYGPVAKVLIAITLLLCLWFLAGVLHEGYRMVNNTPRSSLHEWLYNNRIVVADTECERVAPPGSNPLFRPLGTCEYQSREYEASPAFSIFTRHGITGPRTPWRVLTDVIHLFGALSITFFLTILIFGKGMNGTSRLSKFGQRMFFSTVYTMWLTGYAMFFMQEDTDRGFFPRITPDDYAWLRDALFMAFSVSFINVVQHATMRGKLPTWRRRLLAAQHIVGIFGWVPLIPILLYRLFIIPTNDFNWIYTIELLALVSLYPVLDLINGRVFIETQYLNKDYDWDGHRNDNYYIFWMMVGSTVLFMVGCDRYYFFKGQLVPFWRLTLTVAATIVWIATGAGWRWVSRAFGKNNKFKPAPAA